MKTKFDPTTLEIYRALFTSVAEEMGIALRRTAFSPNIKERRDYSCAVFDAQGRVIAQGDHMPVHLGSMPMAVAAALVEIDFAPGDVVAVNDPFAGGTHLPDVTLVSGVFIHKTRGRGECGDAGKGGCGDAGKGRHGDAGKGRHGDAGKLLRVAASLLPASPRHPFPASTLLRRESRASCGHRRRDAGIDGTRDRYLRRGHSHPANSNRAKRRGR